jgi:3-dehydrosphinganine reductase
MKFAGQRVLITGGSSGIGLALAKELARRGAHVYILARDPQKLQTACLELEAARQSSDQAVGTITADVANQAEVCDALRAFAEENGAPDLLINSAGVAHPGRFEDIPLETFRWMMEVNYFGTVHVIHALLPSMIQRRAGHIVNLSSVAGFLGVYGYSAYGPSKFAVRGLSDVLRCELAEYHIRVSVVFPPDTQTPQLDYENQYKPPILKKLDETNKVLTPEAVAEAILKGVARRKYIITPGFDSTLFYHMNNLLGNLSYRLMDFMLTQARRSLGAPGSHGSQQDKGNPDHI